MRKIPAKNRENREDDEESIRGNKHPVGTTRRLTFHSLRIGDDGGLGDAGGDEGTVVVFVVFVGEFDATVLEQDEKLIGFAVDAATLNAFDIFPSGGEAVGGGNAVLSCDGRVVGIDVAGKRLEPDRAGNGPVPAVVAGGDLAQGQAVERVGMVAGAVVVGLVDGYELRAEAWPGLAGKTDSLVRQAHRGLRASESTSDWARKQASCWTALLSSGTRCGCRCSRRPSAAGTGSDDRQDSIPSCGWRIRRSGLPVRSSRLRCRPDVRANA